MKYCITLSNIRSYRFHHMIFILQKHLNHIVYKEFYGYTSFISGNLQRFERNAHSIFSVVSVISCNLNFLHTA